MNTKLHALKHAHPDGIRVPSPKFDRMTRPAALPARASPPGDRSQISVTSGFALSAAERRSGTPGSPRPSASITFMPARFSTVSFLVGLSDHSVLSGPIGLTGPTPVAPATTPTAPA